MSAVTDYPPQRLDQQQWATHRAMLDEIDNLRNENRRLKVWLGGHIALCPKCDRVHIRSSCAPPSRSPAPDVADAAPSG